MANARKSRLEQPTSSWSKNDWIAAAKLLARKDRPTKIRGLIPRAMHQRFINDLAERVEQHGVAKNKEKTPEKWKLEYAREILQDNEKIRQDLAKKRGVTPSKISNRKIAEYLGCSEAFKEYRNVTGLSKGQTADKIEQVLKYLNRKIKNG